MEQNVVEQCIAMRMRMIDTSSLYFGQHRSLNPNNKSEISEEIKHYCGTIFSLSYFGTNHEIEIKNLMK